VPRAVDLPAAVPVGDVQLHRVHDGRGSAKETGTDHHIQTQGGVLAGHQVVRESEPPLLHTMR
jgi:hypothetical protein